MDIAWRYAADSDLQLLADWNHQLIRDEGHRNQMTVPQLAERMRGWLGGEYKAVIFASEAGPVGYALYRPGPDLVYLRQFFIARGLRGRGYGRAGIGLLRSEVWPAGIRLTVDVLCGNPGGIAFWRAVGFRDYCLTLEILPGGD